MFTSIAFLFNNNNNDDDDDNNNNKCVKLDNGHCMSMNQISRNN
jgi:hypothetical protein